MSAVRRDDRGFTLVEMLISMGLFAIIITIVGSMIISSLTADRTVREVTSSTTDGQLVATLVSDTVRNSTAVQVTPVTGQQSMTLRMRTTTTIALPTPGAVGSEWTLVSTGIVPITGSGGTPTPVFAAQGTRGVALSFTVDGQSGPASLIVTAATGRGPQSNASPQCF